MEAGLIIMAVVLIVTVGVVLYLLNDRDRNKTDAPKGVLHVAYSDGHEPSMFLTLDTPAEEIISQKKVVLYVNVIRENSHK